jgi:hypothetical protein
LENRPEILPTLGKNGLKSSKAWQKLGDNFQGLEKYSNRILDRGRLVHPGG